VAVKVGVVPQPSISWPTGHGVSVDPGVGVNVGVLPASGAAVVRASPGPKLTAAITAHETSTSAAKRRLREKDNMGFSP